MACLRGASPHALSCAQDAPRTGQQSVARRSWANTHHNLHRVSCRTAQADAEVKTVMVETKPEPTGRVARLKATKVGVQPIQESNQPLSAYMALPASQYSVLDARMIERISDSTFKCYVGKLTMFSWSLEPVLTVSVTVEEQGCTIRLLSCEIKGSPMVEDINRKFTAQMTNEVRWKHTEVDQVKEIVSNTSLEVVAQIPGWCAFIPTQSVESVGSKVLQNVLNIMVPRFLAQLQSDYAKWASGDTSRKPIS